MDARKFAVLGVSKAGCIPFEIGTHICAQDCVESLNNLVKLLSSKVKSLLEDLPSSLTGSVFIYIDGIENIDYACCEVIGRHGGLIPCTEMSRVCSDRTKYLFWDPFHPTESAILIATKYMLDGGPEYVSPVNINQLTNS
ncbi:GDSL esterase/lipase At4g16230-like [Hibiscus syriacus]|nr:GDSL esterase/lipase At4g16230-like [Hibiscus syriacus]